MTGKAIKPLYPSLLVSFVAIPFVWNFFSFMGWMFVDEVMEWNSSSAVAIALIISSVFLCVIFYLPSRRHVPIEAYFSAKRIQRASLWPAARLTLGVLLALTSFIFISHWLMAKVGFDHRYDWDGDGRPTRNWDDWLLIGLVHPFTDELLMRAMALRGLLDHYRPWLAVILSAGIYVIARWFYDNPVQIFLLGCYLGVLFVQTRSLWVVTFASSMAYLFREFAVRLEWKYGLESALLEADRPVEAALGISLLMVTGFSGTALAWSGWRRVKQLFPAASDVAETEMVIPSEFKARRTLPGNSTS
jgi:membrane protease YdiL (CAAX protease family)